VLEQLAEIELRLVKARSAGTRAFLRERASLIGLPPFGYKIVKDDGRKTLAPDPDLTPYLLGMVRKYLDGESLTDICHWLDSQNVKPPRSDKWSQKSVGQLLRNKILIGRRIENGRTVLHVEPIIDWPTFNALQSKLDNAPRRRGMSSGDTALLTQVAFCGKCGGPMYRIRDKQGTSYRCSTSPKATGADRYRSVCRNMIPLAELDDWTDEHVRTVLDGNEVLEKITVPGTGHQDEIDQVEAELRSLDFDAPDFADDQARLLAERKRLMILPGEPDKVITRRTGRTYAEVWASLDKDGRRAFLIEHGAKVHAVKGARPSIEIEIS
jgi:site-specific DNA recombinase